MITGYGPNHAKLAIVTDYLSKDEEKSKRPVYGYTASKIREFLTEQDSRLQIPLTDCYCTSFVKRFVPNAEAKSIHVKRKAWENALAEYDWTTVLQQELLKVKPNVVLALGELALRGLTGLKSIQKYRGSILSPLPNWKEQFPNLKIVPTFHPRFLFTQYDARVFVRIDYEKALRYRNDPTPFKEDMVVWVCRDIKSLNEYWTRFRAAKPEFYVCDIETYAGYITYIGFSFDGREGVSIPLLDPRTNNLERAMMWKVVDEILRSDFPLVNQNIKYDAHYLEKWGFTLNNIAGDTMLAGHTLYPELPKNLGFYTSIYTDFPYHKDEGKDFDPSRDPDQLGRYNAKDCVVTWKIYKEMINDLRDFKIYNFYSTRVMPLFHVYRRIDSRGIRVDDLRRNVLLDKYNSIAIQQQHYLELITGYPINVNSNPQIGKFLYEELKLPKHVKTTDAGKLNYVTDAKILEDIYVQLLDDAEIASVLKMIIGLRKVNKAIEFLQGLRVHPDGKLRTTYRLEGTDSGRTSGSEHLDIGIEQVEVTLKTMRKTMLHLFHYGQSFQTLPKHGFEEFEEFEGVLGNDILTIFRPSPGYAFVEGDGSQAEARVVAVLSNDYDTLDMMNKIDFKRNEYGIKDDLHTITAIWTTDKPFERITKFDREKYGKRPRHAGNYDQGPSGLSLWIHRPISECRRILARFHDNVPKLRLVYHAGVKTYVQQHSHLVTPYGRRRDFFGKPNDKLWKVAYSYIPQSTVSDHYKFSIAPIEEHFTEDEAKIVVEKHDSLMAEVREDKVHAWAKVFKEITEKPINFHTGSLQRDFELVIPSEVKFSKDCWSDEMEEIEL